MKDIGKFLGEVKLELSRVIWPKRDEFVGSTIVVVFLTTIMSIYLGVVDKGFDLGMKYLLEWWTS
ncbi:preprotein translocase subunit SecE [Candidatus Dependentiae bacterium]